MNGTMIGSELPVVSLVALFNPRLMQGFEVECSGCFLAGVLLVSMLIFGSVQHKVAPLGTG